MGTFFWEFDPFDPLGDLDDPKSHPPRAPDGWPSPPPSSWNPPGQLAEAQRGPEGAPKAFQKVPRPFPDHPTPLSPMAQIPPKRRFSGGIHETFLRVCPVAGTPTPSKSPSGRPKTAQTMAGSGFGHFVGVLVLSTLWATWATQKVILDILYRSPRAPDGWSSPLRAAGDPPGQPAEAQRGPEGAPKAFQKVARPFPDHPTPLSPMAQIPPKGGFLGVSTKHS